MRIQQLHSWDVSIEQARLLQQRLRNRIILEDQFDIKSIIKIAASDVSFTRYGKYLYAAVVILSFPKLEIQEIHRQKYPAIFPYVPGYLSFREVPAILSLFEKIKNAPDVVLCDGHGIAHPRGIGLASHLGLFLDIPTIGCAKSVLVGDYNEPGLKKGSLKPLIYQGKEIGVVLRTREGVKPIFVSPGHKISLEKSVEIVMTCCPLYRIPEPIRIAHRVVNDLRRENESLKMKI